VSGIGGRRGAAPVLVVAFACAAVVVQAGRAPAPQERPAGQGFSFRTGVELVNVTVTVTDDQGRFVSGLRADDFEVFENGERQRISQFEAERVPVSLGIVLDTSGSMIGDKIVAAQAALNRFLFDLLGSADEVFLYRFDSRATLVQPWTHDRQAASQALGRVKPVGGTALYDALGEAIPLAQRGSQRKKAIVVISDGNDTSSQTSLDAIRHAIRETEVLVYAVGIDASGEAGRGAYQAQGGSGGRTSQAAGSGSGRPPSRPVPSPFPGRKPAYVPPPPPPSPPSSSRARSGSGNPDRLNVDALRSLTDDSGGRTEIIFSERDLDPATAGIASELNQQYFLGYVSTLPKDGRWHTIDVRVRQGSYTVRARRGFVAG
jgi:VWFA-related protein